MIVSFIQGFFGELVVAPGMLKSLGTGPLAGAGVGAGAGVLAGELAAGLAPPESEIGPGAAPAPGAGAAWLDGCCCINSGCAAARSWARSRASAAQGSYGFSRSRRVNST